MHQHNLKTLLLLLDDQITNPALLTSCDLRLCEYILIQASSKLELYQKSEGPQSRIFVTYFGPCREGACPAAA
eukprot:scaffold5989_cov210-Skeletonema_menzelii.AAC.3